MESYTVYKHTSPSGKVYIGITKLGVERRWQGGRNYKNSTHFNSAIAKYGWDNIKHEVLCDGLSREDAENKEIELIKSTTAPTLKKATTSSAAAILRRCQKRRAQKSVRL